jgi:hypothetical protein
MELVERYLQAVKFWLPKKQQDDIIAELSEDLRAQMEEREAGLGRQLNEAEIEDLLRGRGSPMRVANGYLPQRSLIGPILFPIYVLVLKIVTALDLIAFAVGVIAGILSRAVGNQAGTGWTPPLAPLVRHDWTGWMYGMAIVTFVFAVIERTSAKEKLFKNWNPRKLPPLRPAHAIPRSNSVGNLLGLACLGVFWVLKLTPPLTIHLGNLRIATSPGWSFVFWAVLGLSSASFILEVANMLRPWWSMERGIARLLLDIGGLSVFCWSMQARFVASISWPGATAEEKAFTATHLNMLLAHIFPWCAAVAFFIVVFDIWRVFKIRSKSAHSGWNPARNPL